MQPGYYSRTENTTEMKIGFRVKNLLGCANTFNSPSASA